VPQDSCSRLRFGWFDSRGLDAVAAVSGCFLPEPIAFFAGSFGQSFFIVVSTLLLHAVLF
jgi:hypothetical protein